MGSTCILKTCLSSIFKLLLLLVCFSSFNIFTTSSQFVLPPLPQFVLPPLPPALQGLACDVVNCGEGTCKASDATPFGVECDCFPGWKQIPLVSFAFPSCVLPNCTIDFQCGSGAPLPPPPPLPTINATSPCNLVWCGNGKCVDDGTSHFCKCDQGFTNLFGNSSYACFEQCYFGADCKNLGLGPPSPPPPPPPQALPPPPPSTSSGSPETGSKGASTNMKSFRALIMVLMALALLT